jgi:PAS domain S-box-containing protein
MPEQNEAQIILLVEDDAGIAELVREELSGYYQKIVHVATGREARGWLEHNRPQLVLLDYSLPDVSGLELVEQIAASPGGMPPFIVTTGMGDERLAVTMMKHGARDYLVKDVSFLDNLPLVIEQVLREIATEQQLAETERALRESEARYRSIFEGVQDAIFVEALSGKLLDVNQRACEMFGYNREQLLGLTAYDLVPPDHRVVLADDLNDNILPGRPIETVNIRANGEYFPIELSFRHQDMDGEPVILVVVRDITERKRAEQALRESESRLRTLINAMPDIVCFKDEQGRWLEANEFNLHMFQLSGVDYRGKKDSELAAYSAFYRDAFLACEDSDELAWQAGQVSRREEVIPRPDGPSLVFDVIRVPTLTADGERQGLVVVGRDVTERKHAEESLRMAVQEKEVLLRELYHRTKNNMQVISAMLNLEAARSQNEELKKTLRDMDNRIHSMSLVHQKLYQSKSLSNINLKDYLSDLANLMLKSYQIDPGRISISLNAEPIPVLIDCAIPCGLITNEILSNSLKYAFPGEYKGTITIHLSRTDSGMILLEISDNGVGIPAGVNIHDQNTLGTQIIFGIALHQLGAQVDVETSHGVSWRIQFSDNQYHPRV